MKSPLWSLLLVMLSIHVDGVHTYLCNWLSPKPSMLPQMHTRMLSSLLAIAGCIGPTWAKNCRSQGSSNVTETRNLTVPSSPQTGRQVVDANYQSYSVEFSYMQDFAGNDSYGA